MAFCEQCGAELSAGARFCEFCGARVYDEALDIPVKGLEPGHTYYMSFSGRTAILYKDNGIMVRRFNANANIVQASISGDNVTIVTDDGYALLYYWDGRLIRRTRIR